MGSGEDRMVLKGPVLVGTLLLFNLAGCTTIMVDHAELGQKECADRNCDWNSAKSECFCPKNVPGAIRLNTP
jgi:hypothetical protein